MTGTKTRRHIVVGVNGSAASVAAVRWASTGGAVASCRCLPRLRLGQ